MRTKNYVDVLCNMYLCCSHIWLKQVISSFLCILNKYIKQKSIFTTCLFVYHIRVFGVKYKTCLNPIKVQSITQKTVNFWFLLS